GKWEAGSHLANDEQMAQESIAVYRDILNHQRQWLINKNKEDERMDEDIIRKHLRLLDLEEEKLLFL
ncbi:MAG TPA: hypothetical protein VKI61_16475, partial [Chitinophagaceae bacterium]|nr:hypothetical protein [Chitinophagaceae bacterium]